MKLITRFNSWQRLVAGSAATLLLVHLAGCSPSAPQTLVVRGSNTIGEELAPKLAAEYRKLHGGVNFDFEFKATSYGIGALMVGKCDIAAASRELSTTERDLARDRAVEFNDYIIGSYSVAVVVNAGNPVANLSKDQVRDIFTGVVQNWKDVGGPEAPIQLCIRDPISGTHLGFKELAMENKPYAANLKSYTNHTAIIQAVAQNPHAIGYASVELATSPGIKPVSIDNVAPAVATVQKGQYPYARVLRLYTDKARESDSAKQFIQFVLSEQGQKVMDEMGYVPKS